MILTNCIITAYCAAQCCCGPKATGITASGHMPKQGITIAAPRSIPLGSKVTIQGHTYIAQDRTSRRYNDRFDIYFKSHVDAINFGKQTNNVTVK